jgi:glucose-6-phosphate isomerase
MGGSILGSRAIYDFLSHKVKKKITFFDNLSRDRSYTKNKKKKLNIIISKSGNTLETIVNSNILIQKKDKNIFITENKKNYLKLLANKIVAEVIEHKNYVGGRYSVLSEVGMLPSELMNLKEKDFKQFNQLIKNKKFINLLTKNVADILYFLKKKKFTSIILNYDEKSEGIFKWYQQLTAESLGKKSKGILPIISTMPRDNHSLMQFYLDGQQQSFFTFYNVNEKNKNNLKNQIILPSHNFLKGKSVNEIVVAQKSATEKVFMNRKIPFRSIDVFKRDEKTIGELFTFFIMETILLGRALKVNPFDQPSVELIKKETRKILI